MVTPNLKKLLEYIYSPLFDLSAFATDTFYKSPSENFSQDKRPLSESFEGAGFGDEGKGSVVAREIDRLLKDHKKVIAYRWNGGSNAGHELHLKSGKIALHQMPMGTLFENTTSILGRGMVFNPGDALTELAEISSKLGKVPGTIYIDPNITLSLDTHRAWEKVINHWYLGYSSSTGRGIAPSYADDVLRIKLTLSDLMLSNWRGKFGYHYTMMQKLISAFGLSLAETKISTLADSIKGIFVGKKSDFLGRLEEYREKIRPYVNFDLHTFLDREWNLGVTPFIFEGAQAIGLHLKHGVYPDITSSETRARGIQDSSEGIIDFKKIAGRFGVLKGPYISSVGSRILPGEFELATAVNLREKFGEYGATTGRPRGILPPDIPTLMYLRSVSDFDYLVVTHMDTTLAKIPVVLNYKDKLGNPIGFRPYQWQLDKVFPEIVDLPGWDGEAAKKAKTPLDMPENALRFLALLSHTMNTKIAWATNGPMLEDYTSWISS